MCALDVLPHSIFLATDRTDGAAVQRVHDGGACRLVWARDRQLAGQLPARASASVAASRAAGCARVKPRPHCDFCAYKENRAAAEAANINDHKVTNKVLVQSTRAVRRDNGLLEARGRLVNCTDHTLQIEARTIFYDASDLETDAPTAWQRFSLWRHAVQSVAVVGLDQRAARYLLEIRECR